MRNSGHQKKGRRGEFLESVKRGWNTDFAISEEEGVIGKVIGKWAGFWMPDDWRGSI